MVVFDDHSDDNSDGNDERGLNAGGVGDTRERRGQRVRGHPDFPEYGYRRSRKRISHENWGSSSHSPAHIMEQETYYRYAEVAVQRVLYILQLILLHHSSYVSLSLMIGRWSGTSSVIMASAIVSARQKMRQLLHSVDRMFLMVRWIRAHGEIALLYAEDLTVFIRQTHRFGPVRCRRIDDITSHDCYSWFGHYPHNLHRLLLHLRVPESFTVSSGQCFGGEECFLVYLYHLTKGTPFTEMARLIFGGDPLRLSEMNNSFISFEYYTFYNKISGHSMNQWIPQRLHTCRRLIYDVLTSDVIEEVEFDDGQV